ncbi:MAG: DUF1929 domain-containing protein [Rhodothermales bacterium]|nr:DUF1929 domain-containing protein [Rhodothermales bacterium]MBO6778355.1 DUF1929 domain-containing protein [Rhodothermales bacterium]
MRHFPRPAVLAVLTTVALSAPARAQDHNHETHAQSDAFWAAKARNHTGRYVIAAGPLVAQSPADLSELGEWSSVIEWPHVPVSAANLPDGRILTWSSNRTDGFPSGSEFTYASVWDPQTGSFVDTPNHTHDMFCAHLVMLPDGKLLVNGGRNHVKTTSVFDPDTGSWSQTFSMNHGRWYPTTVAMPDGTVFTASGSGQPNAADTAELLTPGSGWAELTGIDWGGISGQLGFESHWWPHLFLDPRGDIVHAGPTSIMHRVTVQGNGQLLEYGPWLPDAWYSKHAAVAMYDEGKILIAGGAGTAVADPATNRALIMDVNGATPVVTEIAPMQHPRRFASAVVLPNGEVLVVGGNTTGIKFSDDGTVLPVEIWSPDAGTWRTVAGISEPRNYHSIALLLDDGRVLSAGGGLCGSGCAANHQDGQVYTPPYLYDAAGALKPRPEILNAPSAVGYSQTFQIQATRDIDYFTMIKASSTTHAVNTDQRLVRLAVRSRSGDNYEVISHPNKNVLSPGYWMLFAVDTDGTPSTSMPVLVTEDLSASLLSIADQESRNLDTVNLQVQWFVPEGMTASFSATGLPPGLSIHAETGLISGTIAAGSTGLHAVEITLTAGQLQDTESFNWTVRDGGTGSILREWWSNIQGDELAGLRSDPRYPDSPSGTDYPDQFEAPTDIANFYGTRMRGFLHPLEDGLYTFWIASDNHGELWLSTSASPDDAQVIATVGHWTPSRDWEKYASQESAQVYLEAGNLYYIEAVHKEGAGGDNLAVAWQTPSRLREVIPGTFLSPFNGSPALANPGDQQDPVGTAVNLQLQAADPENEPLTFSASGLPDGLLLDTQTGMISGILATPGTFTVSAAVTDGTGLESVTFVWTVDSNTAPLAIAGVQSSPIAVGQAGSVSLSVSGPASFDVAWDFGDGTSTTGGAQASHTWSAPGRYQISAVVTAGPESAQVSFFQNVHPAETGQAGSRSSSIVLDASGRIWNVNPDNNSVTVTSANGQVRLAELPVGDNPVALSHAANRVFVVSRGSGTVTSVSTSSLGVVETFDMPFASRPYGIVVRPDGSEAFVALEGSGRVVRLDLSSGLAEQSSSLGPWLRHLALSGDGSRLYVTRFITPPIAGESTANVGTEGGGEVLWIRTSDLGLDRTTTLAYNDVVDTPDRARGIANYLAAPAVSPDGASLWIPSKFDNIFRGLQRDGEAREHDRLVRGGISVIDIPSGNERVADRLDVDDQSHPVASVFGPRGNVLFVAHSGSRAVTAIDPFLGQAITRIAVGRAPTGLALSADGRTLFVHNYMDRTVQSVNVTALTEGGSGVEAPVGQAISTVGIEALDAVVLRGKQLFNDAFDDRLSAQDYLSCASCHAGGAHDGRVWDMTDGGEGLRNTIDLRGRGGTDHGPVHWTANFDEIHDFENDIRGVFDGTGLLNNADFQATQDPLGPLKAGRSPDLDALAAYVASLRESGSSPFRMADGSLSAAAAAGLEIFRQLDCAACHSGTRFTDSPSLTLHDIGTLRASSGSRLGQPLTGIDTPTLRGVWATGPYLHDGSAATLGDAVQAHSGVSVSAGDLANLVAYLQAIDDEEAAAPSSGGPPVVDAIAEQSHLLEEAVSLVVTASEPDGDPVTFSASGLPPGLSMSPDGHITGAGTQAGAYTVTVRAEDIDGSDARQFTWRILQVDVPVESTCYLVADNSGAADVLTMVVDGQESRVGGTGTTRIEGIAYSPTLGSLYAADADRLGRLDTATGAFLDVGAFGSADGADGTRGVSDVDGMAFQPGTGLLFGSVAKSGEPDLLVVIDPVTGSVVPNHFGAGTGYVTIAPVDGVETLDDIAFHPTTGVLYGVGTTSGGTRLFTLNPVTGMTALVGVVDREIEGLGFTTDGRLFGTTGDNGRTIVEIDQITASTTAVATLGEGGTDYESIDCRGPQAEQRISGTVYFDENGDGVLGAGENGQANARLDLFRDLNSDDTLDAGDALLRSVTTAQDGTWSFQLASLGAFLVRLDYASLPPAATPSSEAVAAVSVQSEGQQVSGVDFGYELDQTTASLFCYAVADQGSGLGDGDVLTRISKGSLLETTVGVMGSQLVEAMAFNPQQTTLYGANGRRFGSIDVVTGAFTEIGRFGSGSGLAGNVTFSDVDGLTFDPNTGILYAAVRRSGATDLLIQVDPNTGAAVAGAFSSGDYVEIEAIDGRGDIDDLAIDPLDGQLYAIANGSGSGQVVRIDRETGASTLVASVNDGSLEGLTFDGDGTLLATRGSSFQEVVVVNRSTGATSLWASLGVDGHRDYEAIACLTNDTNTTAGRAYADMNMSGAFDAYDAVLPNLEVSLYRDMNADGRLDSGDALLGVTETDFSGKYTFRTASQGDFLVTTSRPGATVRGVKHHGFGQTAGAEDFVLEIGSATSQETPAQLPKVFELLPAYPNPFNPITTIGFDLPQSATVRLEVFDMTGRRVALLASGAHPAGRHQARFDGSRFASGMYFYRLTAGAQVQTRSVILMK